MPKELQSRNQTAAVRDRADAPSMLATLVSLLFAVAMLAIAVWGIGVSRRVSSSYGSLPAVSVLTYLVLFGPFAVLGVLVLWSGWNKLTGNWPRRVIQELREWLMSALVGESSHSLEPLDDSTTRQLNAMAANAASVTGVLIGLLLIAAGVGGAIVLGVAFFQSKRYMPPPTPSAFYLVGCGLAIIGGVSMLRHVFQKSDERWLIPLRIFTTIVSARVASDSARRQQHGKPVLRLPPADKPSPEAKRNRDTPE